MPRCGCAAPLPQVTWCHRVLDEGEAGLRPEEQSLLDRICEAYYLPAWCRWVLGVLRGRACCTVLQLLGSPITLVGATVLGTLPLLRATHNTPHGADC